MTELAQDVRFALRVLRRKWGVTLIAILSLAIAIGGNTAVFAIIDTFLFTPLSIDEPERVAILQERRTEQPPGLSTLATSLAMHADMKERSRLAEGWAAMRPTVLGLRGEDGSEPISAAEVTADFFEVMGIGLKRGRTFTASEGAPGGGKVVVVTPEFWARHRGEGSEALGQILTLGGEPVQVIGVMPDNFTFLFTTAELFVPLTDAPVESPRDRRDIVSMARMAPSTTMEQLRAEISGIAAAIAREHPEVHRGWTTDVFNARTDIPDSRTKIFYGLLQGSVFFVLMIACVNITNLLMARGQERRREIALRTVLGAGRKRLARQLATESGVMVVAGATLGLALGWVGTRAIANHFGALLPPNYTPSLNPTVVGFTVGISVLAGLFFGLAPAVQTLRSSQSDVLKEGGGRASSSRSRTLVTRSLVVAEIALSLIALAGGGMLIRAFLDIQNADPGFDGSMLVRAQIRVPASKYPDEEELALLLDRVIERVRGIDGAGGAALANALPRGFQTPTDTFHIAGMDRDAATSAPRVFSLKTTPGYAEVLGIDVLQGRFFEAADGPDAAPVAVVNRSFVTAWIPGGDAVGRFVDFQGESRLIVGVLDDVQQVLFNTPGQVEAEAIYIPAAQDPMASYTLVVRSAGDPVELKEPIRTAVRSLDPDLTVSQLLTMEEFDEQAFAGISVFNTILGGFGILAILLASVGTYGVLAYQVTQREHEIGIRMAVGAQGGQVVRMVARQGLWMAVMGLALGGVVLIPLTRLLSSVLAGFGTVRADTGLVVAGILFVVTLTASLVPAYRASSLDPVRALREE